MHTDARYARKVVAVTDNLVPYPASPVSISQSDVDYVVQIDSLGDPKKIVSTTTRVTRDPAGLLIAHYAAEVIEAAGLLRNGFSFQTGAGGTSLAVAENVRNRMRELEIKGSFGCGGITGYFVDMLEEGLLPHPIRRAVLRLAAVQSIGRNLMHREISADLYANPFNRGCVVNMLDCVILGATEVDVNFNVNVNTESNGLLLHNTGGHCDTAAGAKLAIVVAPSIRGRLPIIRDEVTTITTPGETVDVIVTERGIAVADRHPELTGARPVKAPPAGAGHPGPAHGDHQAHRSAAAGGIRRRGGRAHRVPRRLDHRRGPPRQGVGRFQPRPPPCWPRAMRGKPPGPGLSRAPGPARPGRDLDVGQRAGCRQAAARDRPPVRCGHSGSDRACARRRE